MTMDFELIAPAETTTTSAEISSYTSLRFTMILVTSRPEGLVCSLST